MSNPVDLTNLRNMTDGDTELEQALFEEFYSSFEAGIATMQTNVASSEIWQKTAHALKGIALNLGANALGELCKQAQESHLKASDAKENTLKQIENEYSKVKTFLGADFLDS